MRNHIAFLPFANNNADIHVLVATVFVLPSGFLSFEGTFYNRVQRETTGLSKQANRFVRVQHTILLSIGQ
jgi:hypothetical protein